MCCDVCQVLTFGPGESEQSVTVTILDSNVPKPERQFEVILANPSEGLLLGHPAIGLQLTLFTLGSFSVSVQLSLAIPLWVGAMSANVPA